MYVTLMTTLRAFMGANTLLAIILTAAIIVIVLALAASVTNAFRAGLERWRSETGWRANVAGIGTGLFKVLVIFVFTRLLVVAMHFQAQSFEQQYGRVTDRKSVV